MNDITISYKEIIKHNKESLSKRLIIYSVLAFFFLIFLLFLHISDGLEISKTSIFFSLLPFAIIALILYSDLLNLKHNNKKLIEVINIKAFHLSEITPIILWENASGLSYNNLIAYIPFQNYKIFISYFYSSQLGNVDEYISLEPNNIKNPKDDYRIAAYRNYSLHFTLEEWQIKSQQDIFDHLSDIITNIKQADILSEN